MYRLACSLSFLSFFSTVALAQRAAVAPTTVRLAPSGPLWGWSVNLCLPQIICHSEQGLQVAHEVDPTPDGCATLAATPFNPMGDTGPKYLWIGRQAPDGRVMWERTIEPAGTMIGYAPGARVSHDSARLYVAASPVNVLALSPAGELLWSRKVDSAFGNADLSTGITPWCVRGAVGDGCLVAFTRLIGLPFPTAAAVVRFDSAGNVLWETQVGQSPSGSPDDRVVDLAATSDGGALVLASVPTLGTALYRLDAVGNVVWHAAYDLGVPTALAVTATDGALITGSEAGNPAHGTVLFEIDPDGTVLWSEALLNAPRPRDIAVPSSGGCLLLAGGLVRLRPGGAFQWARGYGGAGPGGLYGIGIGPGDEISAVGYQLALDPGGLWSYRTAPNGILSTQPGSGILGGSPITYETIVRPVADVTGILYETHLPGIVAEFPVTVTPVRSTFGRQAP